MYHIFLEKSLAHEKSGPGTFCDIALSSYVTGDVDGVKVQQFLGSLYALTSAV